MREAGHDTRENRKMVERERRTQNVGRKGARKQADGIRVERREKGRHKTGRWEIYKEIGDSQGDRQETGRPGDMKMGEKEMVDRQQDGRQGDGKHGDWEKEDRKTGEREM